MKPLYLISFVPIVLALSDLKPPVSPETFPSLINLDDLLHGAQILEDFAYSYPDRNRVFGGAAHTDTINYLYDELQKTGYYDVVKQPQTHLWTKSEQKLTVGGGSIAAGAMTYSPSVNVTAEVVVIDNEGCNAADYPTDVAGKIALVERGVCTFGEKSVMAASVRAAAAIVYNDADGSMSGTLGSSSSPLGPYAPIVGISHSDGQSLFNRLESGTVMAELYINSLMENRTTYNVIAQTKGGDPKNVVALGGHTDSVEAGPGINDDGSGIISNLVIAKALAQFEVKNAVRFLFWTAEEFGLLGSDHYVSNLNETDLDSIRLYLNMDMIASPNYALMIYDGDGSDYNKTGPKGSAEIEHLFESYFDSINLPYLATEFNGRSDYAAFIENDIPAGGLFTGAEEIMSKEDAEVFKGKEGLAYDANYHAAGDNMTNLNHEAFLINSKATAFAVATYANSLDSIPKHNSTMKLMSSMKRMIKSPVNHSHGGCFHTAVLI
ncbi:hypothetical protein ASPWEDRAFT_121719 [Aspergillus wentii DTO 134E9]|uniref:Peptide hydrolase n=1 Tax=Aspergillus wentii DTO 134E9 TaxID=1073089 RepID=A0A1L9R4V5_ASPWE|nr:uncharacterized protein ASPWEDRAFT_121719 [Aspergillus wentii DTO 134E9]OJJ29949.1 hypothetical protein ASPWEDRAFT_121719 [Aspergillus wentii DTO 134E9]